MSACFAGAGEGSSLDQPKSRSHTTMPMDTPQSRIPSLNARGDELTGCPSSDVTIPPTSSHIGVDMYLMLRSSTRSSPSPQHHCFSIHSVSSRYASIGSTRLQRLVRRSTPRARSLLQSSPSDAFEHHHQRHAREAQVSRPRALYDRTLQSSDVDRANHV
ncbi:hypothetical protein B0H19DRAFT_597663 [Mycena capillaripes]|nr:hypothetical protein B0H19DRAFT_597663 [Mycena capillaripes]